MSEVLRKSPWSHSRYIPRETIRNLLKYNVYKLKFSIKCDQAFRKGKIPFTRGHQAVNGQKILQRC